MKETLCQELIQKFSKALAMFDNNPSLKRLNESFTRNECEMIFRSVVLQYLTLESERTALSFEEILKRG